VWRAYVFTFTFASLAVMSCIRQEFPDSPCKPPVSAAGACTTTADCPRLGFRGPCIETRCYAFAVDAGND
jgi:hypothetical protein